MPTLRLDGTTVGWNYGWMELRLDGTWMKVVRWALPTQLDGVLGLGIAGCGLMWPNVVIHTLGNDRGFNPTQYFLRKDDGHDRRGEFRASGV
jgi:hypothetical protein